MKLLRLAALIALACFVLPLAGCTTLNQIGSAYSMLTDASVPQATAAAAVQSFDIIKESATAYVAYCTPNPAPAGCNDALIQKKVDPAITAGTQARDGLWGYVKAHPGQLGSKGLYDALTTATQTLNSMAATFAVAVK